ncbi:putative sulfate exporter family transporter [Streptomyces sp. N2-109]|uniref:Sulfate exporter family transporter n=1 Tax=Streptomyces gossypii TaxID=2883101 RepID=A0ABT2JTP9_9ACTN|nr:putative sulfate exporter family transporter [Streptomyces gossypii]MCT2591261.1 putative sulfate exporter family transporter [Streptomyces gossypii]
MSLLSDRIGPDSTGASGTGTTRPAPARAASVPAASVPAVPAVPAAPAVSGAPAVRPPRPSPLPGLALAAAGVGLAEAVHLLLPAVPMLTAAVVLGIAAAHLPGVRRWVCGPARPGLSLAGKRLMRIGVVLLGLELSMGDVLAIGWPTVVMVCVVVAATFGGTLWMGRRLGLTGDQPLLIATGYSICGASAIGAVGEVRKSDERDVATSVALVTLCGTLAIAVLPLLHHPLGLTDAEFGRWVGAGVHDVGQVVAAAGTAGDGALGEAVLVKLMRVMLLAPLVACVVLSVRRRAAAVASGAQGAARPPLVPLFVAGFVAFVAVRTTGLLPEGALEIAGDGRELLLAAALFGLGSAVHLPTLARTGKKVAVLGLGAWVVVAGLSYAGVLVTT